MLCSWLVLECMLCSWLVLECMLCSWLVLECILCSWLVLDCMLCSWLVLRMYAVLLVSLCSRWVSCKVTQSKVWSLFTLGNRIELKVASFQADWAPYSDRTTYCTWLELENKDTYICICRENWPIWIYGLTWLMENNGLRLELGVELGSLK